MGRSPVLVMESTAVLRPRLSSISPSLINISPGIMLASPQCVMAVLVTASSDRFMDRHQLGPVRKRRLDLDLADHFGDPVHHLRAREHVRTRLHQLGDGPARARALAAAALRPRAPSTMKSVISATASG